MARLKKGWSQKNRNRSLQDIGGAISFNIWQSSGQSVLDLENQGFQIETYSQRLDVLSEFSAFLLQIVDRISYEDFDDIQRSQLITATGLHLAEVMQDNRVETNGAGDYRPDYLTLLNSRIGTYSSCYFDNSEGPSFVFLRHLGDFVTSVMGEKDQQWITTYIIDHLGPTMYAQLKKVLPGLIDPALREAEDAFLQGRNYDS